MLNLISTAFFAPFVPFVVKSNDELGIADFLTISPRWTTFPSPKFRCFGDD